MSVLTTIFYVVTIVGAIGGSVSAVFMANLWLQAQKRQSVAAAKDELIQMATQSRDAWQARYEAEHLEITNYREQVHKKNDETNLRIIELTNENADLRAKTDLSPVTELMQGFMKEQTKINAKILSALENLEKRINGKSRRCRVTPA